MPRCNWRFPQTDRPTTDSRRVTRSTSGCTGATGESNNQTNDNGDEREIVDENDRRRGKSSTRTIDGRATIDRSNRLAGVASHRPTLRGHDVARSLDDVLDAPVRSTVLDAPTRSTLDATVTARHSAVPKHHGRGGALPSATTILGAVWRPIQVGSDQPDWIHRAAGMDPVLTGAYATSGKEALHEV